MPNNTQKGFEGEEIAVNYLLKSGYSVLERNWRTKHLEIDIIAKKNETLAIVEVKWRNSDVFGSPEEFVTKAKQKKIIKAAHFYLKKQGLDLETRFDIISITQHPELKIEHIKDAFYPLL
jgi:putative endonuclease